MCEDKKKDLMMKAAIQFNGVWPCNRATHLVTTSQTWDGGKEYNGKIYSYTEEGNYCIGGELDGIGLQMNKNSWQILCTRQEFESFVESLFDGAPDDAEIYVEVKETDYLPEYKGFAFINSLGNYELMSEGNWVSSVDIEIPRPKKKEWQPEVDINCLGDILDFSSGEHYVLEVTPLRNLGESWAVMVARDGGLAYCDKFRPLKTEKEKNIESIKSVIDNWVANNNNGTLLLATLLHNEGYTKQ